MSIHAMHKVNHIFLVILYIVNPIFLCYNMSIMKEVPIYFGVPERRKTMPPSEAQKRASNEYQKKHMATIGCKLRKEEASAFKAYCANQRKTTNTVLKDFVMECIGDIPTSDE